MFFLLLGVLVFTISNQYPQLTEDFYSLSTYKVLGQSISSTTGLVSFSVAEPIIVGLIIYLTSLAVYILARTIKEKDGIKIIKRFTGKSVTILGIVYFTFQILWGINYNRREISQSLGFDTQAPTQAELAVLCNRLATEASQLRQGLEEDEYGVVSLPYGKHQALKMAYKGFDKASHYYPNLRGHYGDPKPIILSNLMSFTGITGFYFPFTGEANINMRIPEPLFAFTVAHEMAHQRGFAREDEANFVSYISCLHHPDEYFQYAGALSALIYSMNALGQINRDMYQDIVNNYGGGVLRDLEYHKKFWQRHSGPIEKVSNRVNDAYLKAQNQKGGVKSYGAMVDLLIGLQRKKP